jgi:hypothetical protein
MPFVHYTQAQAAAVRAEHPGHFVVERINQHASCLVLIPDTEDNRKRITEKFPVPDAALIDGLTFHYEAP